MYIVIDLVYNVFLKVENNGRLMLRGSFMMNICKPLYKKLPELKEYCLKCPVYPFVQLWLGTQTSDLDFFLKKLPRKIHWKLCWRL